MCMCMQDRDKDKEKTAVKTAANTKQSVFIFYDSAIPSPV